MNLSTIQNLYPSGVEKCKPESHKRHGYSDDKKLEVIQYANRHTLSKAAEKFGICRGTLGTWLTEFNQEVY